MVRITGRNAPAFDFASGVKAGERNIILSSPEACAVALEDLLDASPDELSREDIALLNLLCAPMLPGSETLEIPKCLARLDRLSRFLGDCTRRNLRRFPTDPTYGHCEPMATALQQHGSREEAGRPVDWPDR